MKFRTVFFVLVLTVAALVLIPVPAKADVIAIPTYMYLYPCDSGVVNCDTFDRNNINNGDFGMNGIVPTNWRPGVPTLGLQVLISNLEGEVLGKVESMTGNALAYGFQGLVTCIATSVCNDAGWTPEGINSNGLYVFSGSGLGTGVVGLGFDQFGRLASGPGGVLNLVNYSGDPIIEVDPFGINNDNQILARIDTTGSIFQGVLSPTAVPEPSALVPIAIVLCACLVMVRRRCTGV